MMSVYVVKMIILHCNKLVSSSMLLCQIFFSSGAKEFCQLAGSFLRQHFASFTDV